MTCRSFMMPNPLALRGTDTVGAAAHQLVKHRYVNMPVVDGANRYLGMFGVFELLALLLPTGATLDHLVLDLGFMADDVSGLRQKLAELGPQPIAKLARTDLPVLKPDTAIVEALLLFYRGRSSLAVVEEGTGTLLGMLSYWDALAALIGPRP